MGRNSLRRRLRQSLAVGSITALLSVLVCTSVNAQTGEKVRRVHVSGQQLTLESIFKTIKNQTGLTVFYDSRLLDDQDKVTLDFKNGTLEEVLNYVLANRNISYEIRRNQVIVLNRKAADNHAGAAAFSLSGTVTDTEGTPLPGVTIKVSNSNAGTSTGSQGEYVLAGISEDAALDVTYLGCVPQHIAIGKRPVIHIRLSRATSVLDETVIMGYGTTTKRYNTGTISRINSAVFEEQPVGNPLLALQGRAPGLVVTATSGKAGANVVVQIRGQNSIGENSPYVTRNEPLYIVDGVPFFSVPLNQFDALGTPVQGSRSPLNSISPDDIASIEILKDGDATAIYGSKGANGVILITTKRAQRNGKLAVNANVYAGAGKVTHMLDMLNTDQYLALRKEAFANDNIQPTAANAPDLVTYDQHAYTDWQKYLIGGTAHVSDAQVSLSGGDSKNRFMLGSNYHKETTVNPGDGRDQRIAFNASYDFTSEDAKFNLAFAANYTNDDDKNFSGDLANLYNLPPNFPLYKADGKMNWDMGNNPAAKLLQRYNNKAAYLNSNVTMRYAILDNLQLKLNLGYNQNSMDQYLANPLSSLDPRYYKQSVAYFGNTQRKGFIIEPQVDYQLKLGSGTLKALVGATWQKRTSDGYYITASGYSSEATMGSMQGATSLVASSSYGNPNVGYNDYRYQSIFGRLTYNLLGKYVVNGTVRRDGSSRFAPENRYGNFGALGAAWIFSEESFVKDHLPFLSFGKLRSSYGITGNDMIGDYGYMSSWTVSGNSYNGVNTLVPSRLANSGFGWEKVAKADVALETGFLQDKLLLNINFYNNRTTNQLVGYNLPFSAGFTSVQYNLPAVTRNQGWEFEVSSTNLSRKSFKWTTSFNLTIPQNKLVSYPGLESSSYRYNYAIGQPLQVSKGYEFTGVDPKTGAPQFTSMDFNKRIVLGTRTPAYYGGLQNTLRYKDWQLDIFVQYSKQSGFNYFNNAWNNIGALGNFDVTVLDRWKNPGDATNIPRATTYSPVWFNYMNATQNWGDASFIRLKNVYLAYNIPSAWRSRLRLSNCRIYLQGQNLLTITNYLGFDPETQGIFQPPLKMYTAGIQLSL
ncbi:MAG: SusC/RagA family TonB-linked outer membrane protein [Chitinophaga sp.]|uniref:SusC/RagA family TonB-linked outer membrane protein n=1 Tax=Chitinophaga sp. TaxID=1869181 RepID=UPI001AFF1290|nr:SusC/RagA family TonB-linked outer membrane protein [Chitinophaga sp.]MBO9727486.1 SusC/RagA family TonB-linked outer membrane protein [Chitinophaga sp.]